MVLVLCTEGFTTMNWQSAREEGPSRGRAVPVHIMARENDALFRELRDVASHSEHVF